jgi:hypothetical protein
MALSSDNSGMNGTTATIVTGLQVQTGRIHAATHVRSLNGTTFADSRCNVRNARMFLVDIADRSLADITCQRCHARVARIGR